MRHAQDLSIASHLLARVRSARPHLRTTLLAALALATACLAGCGGDPASPGGSTPPGSDAGSPPVSEPDAGLTPPPPPAEIQWSGTWNAHVIFTAICMWSSLGAPNTANLDYNVTAELGGANASITAVFASNAAYTMTGTGNASRLLLAGQFPGRDHNNNNASTIMRENNVSIALREVIDLNTARGTIEGNYDTRGGISCVIQPGGTVELSR
jgi:hypothetical protein